MKAIITGTHVHILKKGNRCKVYPTFYVEKRSFFQFVKWVFSKKQVSISHLSDFNKPIKFVDLSIYGLFKAIYVKLIFKHI